MTFAIENHDLLITRGFANTSQFMQMIESNKEFGHLWGEALQHLVFVLAKSNTFPASNHLIYHPTTCPKIEFFPDAVLYNHNTSLTVQYKWKHFGWSGDTDFKNLLLYNNSPTDVIQIGVSNENCFTDQLRYLNKDKNGYFKNLYPIVQVVNYDFLNTTLTEEQSESFRSILNNDFLTYLKTDWSVKNKIIGEHLSIHKDTIISKKEFLEKMYSKPFVNIDVQSKIFD